MCIRDRNAFCTMWQSPANSAWTLARPEGYTRGPVQQSFSSAGPPGLPTLAGGGAVSINVPAGSRLLRFFATNTLEDYLEVDPGPGGTGARVNWYTAYTGTDPGAPFSNIQADQTYAVDDLTPMSGAGGLYTFHPRYKVHVENSTPGLGFMTCPLFLSLIHI